MKILVVDDEKLLVKGIKFNLENDGYEVVTGCDGMEAVELAASESPDLIVLDPDDAAARRAGGLHEDPRILTGPYYYVNRKIRRHGQAPRL